MADAKITGLAEDTAPTSDDLVTTVHDPAGTPANRKVTLANLAKGLGGAWATWDITWTNLTETSGTETAVYTQIGKTVRCRFTFTFGASSAISGSVSLSLPVTAATYDAGVPVGLVQCVDASGGNFFGPIFITSTTVANVKLFRTDSTYASQSNLSSTVPMTWTTSDKLVGQFMYEAA